jgi:urease subunit alpha
MSDHQHPHPHPHRHSHGQFEHAHDEGAVPHSHVAPDEVMPGDYAAIHGPTVGDRVRLGDTGLVIRIEYDAQERGNEFLAGFGKTARDGLLLQAAAVRDTCDIVISNVVIIDATRRIGKVSIGIRDGRICAVGRAGNPVPVPRSSPVKG